MNNRTEYWIIMFWKQWPPFQLQVSSDYFSVALCDSKATVVIADGSKKGKWLIESKKVFHHLNKWFIVAEVSKVKEPSKVLP